ncbi:unnamed protein product [Aphanomyces euteiches]
MANYPYSTNTSDLSTETRQKRLVMKHELYMKEQEAIQKQVQINIAEALTKQRNKREANFLKLRNDIEEGKVLAEELGERLTLKEETAKRQKQRLYDEWTEKVYNKLNRPINEKIKSMDPKALNQHKQEAYQHFLDTVNKKGCLFRDIIIESEYDPLNDNKAVKYRTRVDDPCSRVLKTRDEEDAIAKEGRNVMNESMDSTSTSGNVVLGRCDNLDTKLWAKGIFESTPYGYFNKMMASTISEESSKTYQSRVKFDHYGIEQGSATLNQEFPKGKRTTFGGIAGLKSKDQYVFMKRTKRVWEWLETNFLKHDSHGDYFLTCSRDSKEIVVEMTI